MMYTLPHQPLYLLRSLLYVLLLVVGAMLVVGPAGGDKVTPEASDFGYEIYQPCSTSANTTHLSAECSSGSSCQLQPMAGVFDAVQITSAAAFGLLFDFYWSSIGAHPEPDPPKLVPQL